MFVFVVLASQFDFQSARSDDVVELSYGWEDHVGEAHRLDVSLPRRAVTADLQEPTWLPRKRMAQEVSELIDDWGRKQPGVQFDAVPTDDGVEIRVKGHPSRVKKVVKLADGIRDQATNTWLYNNGFLRLSDDKISVDHARLVREYVPLVRPIAQELRSRAHSDRAFVDLALSFVQSIPYANRTKKGRDIGYVRPGAVLARNRGDCDSKSVLFLAIIRSVLPDLPLSMVYVPGHALVGLGLDADGGDRRFKSEGVRYIFAEPTGPAPLAAGRIHPDTEAQIKRATVLPVAVDLS